MRTILKPSPLSCIAVAALVAAPLAASAQTTAYVPPKLLAAGTNTTPISGKGEVTVQVFVKKDGTFTVSKVIKSTNPADNDAALEVAKTGHYKPALREGKPVDAYYDYIVNFAGEAATTSAGPMGPILANIRAAKYDDAKAQLNTYLAAHPGDTQAYTLLGVANGFGGDAGAASMAFEKAGTIPDQYKTLAIQSYAKYASSLLDAKKFPEAITYATRAIDADPNNLQGYYVRGIAYSNSQNDAAAIADLAKARTIAIAAKSDDKTLATIGFNLAVTQYDAGQFGEGSTTAKDVVRLDPSRKDQLDKFAFASINNTAVSLANDGKVDDAVARLESGATAFPAQAGQFYAQAALILATAKKPAWNKVQMEADKVLAISPADGRGNFYRGIAAAQQQDVRSASTYLNKAKASTAYASDPALAKQVDAAIKAISDK